MLVDEKGLDFLWHASLLCLSFYLGFLLTPLSMHACYTRDTFKGNLSSQESCQVSIKGRDLRPAFQILSL